MVVASLVEEVLAAWAVVVSVGVVLKAWAVVNLVAAVVTAWAVLGVEDADDALP